MRLGLRLGFIDLAHLAEDVARYATVAQQL